ncbi:hypothetical protein [Longitalea luteola]|uniref:hypothetical protein n=1 Tax=Longitalea luteola TaxID=2812563 RepID=UPI001A95F778|nr:hypothetical protein [Longitalea luteola]
MLLKQRLFSNMILRNMISDWVGLSGNNKAPGTFPIFFQYKIGPYKPDYFLYFQKEPFSVRYKNDIFNKLYEYSGSDISDYINFHYNHYQDKQAFLKFLRYEVHDRLNIKLTGIWKQKLQFVLYWLQEKEQELTAMQHSQLQHEIEQGMRAIANDPEVVNPGKADELVNDLSEKLNLLVEKLSEGYATGNIRVAEQKHLHSLIQLLYILQNLQKNSRNGKANQRLFSTFSAIDMAAILRLHFADWKEKQQNTIQKDIAAVTKDINVDSEKFKRLDKALQDFFFDQNP